MNVKSPGCAAGESRSSIYGGIVDHFFVHADAARSGLALGELREIDAPETRKKFPNQK